ncbi:hypothetical protein BH11PLA2_BH11PLA2_49940 [soil metagenome]
MSVRRQSLVLDSVTLRGIGSYLNGARLDIRPLTVLCGENGSGKSTWFNTLNLLKRSLAIPLFRFELASTQSFAGLHDYTNAYLKTFPEYCIDEEPNRDFGPFGTIGLNIVATESITFPNELDALHNPALDSHSAIKTFLWKGFCPKGTNFRIRICHPTTMAVFSDEPQPQLCDLVELQINGLIAIRFRKLLHEKQYSVYSPSSFFTDEIADETFHKICDYIAPNSLVPPINNAIDPEALHLFCTTAISRICQLLRHILDGFYYISAIRDIETRSTTQEEQPYDAAPSTAGDRYVGAKGQHTWDLESIYAYNPILHAVSDVLEPAGSSFTASEIVHGYQIWEAIHWPERSYLPAQAARIREMSDEASWQIFEDAALQLKATFDAPPDFDEMEARRDKIHDEFEAIAQAFVAICNNLINRRDFFLSDVRSSLEGDAAELADKGVDKLSYSEVRRFNRRLIEATFNKSSKLIRRIPRFNLEMYVSYWLNKLVRTKIIHRDIESGSLDQYWLDHSNPPVGFLENLSPEEWGSKADRWADGIPNGPADDLNRFLHVCFGYLSPMPVTPRFLSAGFHQIAPIIVQAALMQKCEVMAIENPEVHLHPSLQLEITAYLIQESKSGKRVILETHSDLVVRRVMRSILSEDIAQSCVAMYFASLIQLAPSEHFHSHLERIQINEQGQVANWPDGFMNDDVRESRMLMNAMYRQQNKDDHNESS